MKLKPIPVTDEFENSPQNYNPNKIAESFNGNYIEHKNGSNEKLSIEQHQP